MFQSKSFLSVDIGAGSLKVVEIEPTELGGLRLRQFDIRSLGMEGALESKREAATKRELQAAISESGFTSKLINVCAPGFHVFSKFVRLPAVDNSKISQIIQYEAQQNVPFPLNEVVWDYQILGSSPSGELEVLLVAIKTDIVEGLFGIAENSGLKVNLVDVSPAALCNAFRYNYPEFEEEEDGSTMLLDIGAKTSTLLFFEKGKVYARTINIGANTITQEFAAEAKLPFAKAEIVKLEGGMVSLGGAYADPEDPQHAQLSKIARQVLTRLHIQMNQTLQFFRGQQGGSAPKRLFLSGGGSSLLYTKEFFEEKLNVEVDYFNPLKAVELEEGLDLETLSVTAHTLGQTIGLALRNTMECPVELNLMPSSAISRQEFNHKKPYLIAAVFSLILVIFAFGWFYQRLADVKSEASAELDESLQPLLNKERSLDSEMSKLKSAKTELQELTGWMKERVLWIDILQEVRTIMLQAEARSIRPDQAGIWVERLSADLPNDPAAGVDPMAVDPYASTTSSAPTYQMDPMMMQRYGITPGSPGAPAAAPDPYGAPGAPGAGGAAEDSVTSITLRCRGINLSQISASANGDLAFELEKAFQASELFGEESQLTGDIAIDPDQLTFSFGMTLKLNQPINL
jgi:type IV pilus assembly protein PilM